MDDLSDSTITLDCQHTFHSHCAVQWFRYNNVCCPLCRAEDVEKQWSRPTPQVRVAYMRRVKTTLPKMVQRRLASYDEWNSKLKLRKSSYNSFRTRNRAILREQTKMRTAVSRAQIMTEGLLRQLNRINVPNIPYLCVPESEDSDESSVDSGDDSGEGSGEEIAVAYM